MGPYGSKVVYLKLEMPENTQLAATPLFRGDQFQIKYLKKSVVIPKRFIKELRGYGITIAYDWWS